MGKARVALLVWLTLHSLAACSEGRQCERAAAGTGIPATIYNPDGISTPLGLFGGLRYGETCQVFPHGRFTPVEGIEGLYRYALPQHRGVLAGGRYCPTGTLVRLSDATRRPYEEAVLADLRACEALRAAATH